MKQQMRNLIHIKTNELKKYMEIKSINTLSITECCEQLNIRRDDLPKALQDIIVLSERERLLIDQLQFLLDNDKSAIESCRTIEQYEGYLSTWVDGLYHDYARTKITQLKAVSKNKQKLIFLLAGIMIILGTLSFIIFRSDVPDKYAEPESIDLGLSVNWASCNIGARTSEDFGDYYSWMKTNNTINSEHDYFNDAEVADVASAKWGNAWRIPTKTEFEELINNCSWEWTSKNGVNGYRIISRINGNSIFLPATHRQFTDRCGDYWTSTPSNAIHDPGSGPKYGMCAFALFFGTAKIEFNDGLKYYGRTIRPVTNSSPKN